MNGVGMRGRPLPSWHPRGQHSSSLKQRAGAPIQSSSPPATSVEPQRTAGRPPGSSAESPPRRVLTLGDNAYPDGRLWQYRAYYRPNWGRFKAKTSPVPGNHDFHTPDARGYRDYFGARAPAFYYSYDVGAWHLIALSSDLDVSVGSPQERWLRRDLAKHPRRCILAYWHHPRFTSGTLHASDLRLDPFWRALYAARADVVLNGHVHNYERFARQDPGGHRTREGIREFVVGTGGISLYESGRPIKNSQAQNDTTFGVLKLRLHRRSYHWKFVRAAGGRFDDSGTTRCSRRP